MATAFEVEPGPAGETAPIDWGAIQHTVEGMVHPKIKVDVLGETITLNSAASDRHDVLALRVLFWFADRFGRDRCRMMGAGVFVDDDPLALHMQPDFVFLQHGLDGERILGSDVELVAEVISPSNGDVDTYVKAIVERATEYGIRRVFFVHPTDEWTEEYVDGKVRRPIGQGKFATPTWDDLT